MCPNNLDTCPKYIGPPDLDPGPQDLDMGPENLDIFRNLYYNVPWNLTFSWIDIATCMSTLRCRSDGERKKLKKKKKSDSEIRQDFSDPAMSKSSLTAVDSPRAGTVRSGKLSPTQYMGVRPRSIGQVSVEGIWTRRQVHVKWNGGSS